LKTDGEKNLNRREGKLRETRIARMNTNLGKSKAFILKEIRKEF